MQITLLISETGSDNIDKAPKRLCQHITNFSMISDHENELYSVQFEYFPKQTEISEPVPVV